MASLFENYNQPVIYKITNKCNGKFYIGSAVNFKERKRCHLKELRMNHHHNRYLQSDFILNGESSFIFEIIEFVKKKECLINAEQQWIDKLRPEFNILPNAGSSLGCKLSKERVEQMKMTCKPPSQKGLKRSLHTIQLIIKNKTGVKQSVATIEKRVSKFRGHPKPDGLMQKLSEYRSPKTYDKIASLERRPIREYSIKGDFIKEFFCAKEVIESGIGQTSLYDVLSGRKKHFKGRVFKYYGKTTKWNLKNLA